MISAWEGGGGKVLTKWGATVKRLQNNNLIIYNPLTKGLKPPQLVLYFPMRKKFTWDMMF
jgi:hypothetical protein